MIYVPYRHPWEKLSTFHLEKLLLRSMSPQSLLFWPSSSSFQSNGLTSPRIPLHCSNETQTSDLPFQFLYSFIDWKRTRLHLLSLSFYYFQLKYKYRTLLSYSYPQEVSILKLPHQTSWCVGNYIFADSWWLSLLRMPRAITGFFFSLPK